MFLNRLFDVFVSNLVPNWRAFQDGLRQSKAFLVVSRNVRWLLVGVAIRVVFMPIAAQGDLIGFVYWGGLTAFGPGFWNPYSFLATKYPDPIFWIPYPPPFLYFEASLVKLASLFLPNFGLFFNELVTEFPANPASPFTAGTSYYFYPYIHELLVLLKFPYLLLDIATAILLSLMLSETIKSDFVFKFWMLNPVSIFASYIIGQFDIIPVFFVVLALYYANKWKPTACAFSLGLGAAFKTFPFLLLPIVILGFRQSLAQRLRLLFWGVVPFLIVSLPFIQTKAYIQGVILGVQSSRYGAYATAATINVGVFDQFAIFIALYAIIVLHCFSSPRTPSAIWRWMFAILLCFFSFSIFNVQWFLWVAPLAGLAAVGNRKMLSYYVLLCICYFVYTFNWGAPLAGYLFAPLNPVFTSLPAPRDLVAQIMDPSRFILLFRSVFTGTALWSAYLAIRNINGGAKLEAEDIGRV